MGKETKRLDEELDKHSNFEEEQVKKHEQGVGQCETSEMEAKRDANLEQLTLRKQLVETLTKNTGLFVILEKRDRDKATDIMTDFQATAQQYEALHKQTQMLGEKYNKVHSELDKTKDVTKLTVSNFEKEPSENAAKTHS